MKKQKKILCAALIGMFALTGGFITMQTYEASAANDIGFKVEETAALRLNEPEGLRFRVSLSETQKETFGENAEYGVLLLPESMLGSSKLEFGEDGQVVIEDTLVITAKAWTEDNDDSIATYSCVLSAPVDENGANTAFPSTFYNVPIAARGYVKDATGAITYTENVATRSIGYIAKLCEVEGLTTAEATKEQYAGIATIAQGTQATLSINDGQVLSTGKMYNPEFVVGGMDANSSPKADISYESSNPSVVSVEGDSLSANVAGNATITAKISCNGSGAKAIASVDVTVRTDFASLRVGDEANTLFFFDQVAGEEQITEVGTGVTYGYTTEKAYASEKGSLKVTLPGTASQNTVRYDLKGYAYNEGDYAVFYVYNDSDSDFVQLMFNYNNSVFLEKGKWTAVVRPVSVVAGQYFRFFSMNNTDANGAAAAWTSANANGSLYISKAKVYPSTAIENLTKATGDWTVGNMTFTGELKSYNNAINNATYAGFLADDLQYAPYIFNGAMHMTLWEHGYAGFYATLKTAVDVSTENQYIAITAKGALADKFTVLPLGGNGEYDAFTGSLKPIKTIEGADGSVTYIFEVPKTAGRTINALRVTPLGSTTSSWKAVNVSISDIQIGDISILRMGEDARTLFFFDQTVGTQQITTVGTGVTYGYTTEKAYASEAGSLKVTLPGNASQNTVRYDIKNYAYAADDYAVFYVYNDTDSDFVQLMFGYNNSVFLEKGKWTAVVRPVSVVAGQYFRFFSMNNTDANGAAAAWTSANANGSLYISKAKVYPSTAIENLTKATGDWTVGNMTFTGELKSYNNAINNATYAGFLADDLQYAPYIFNGAMYMTIWEHSYAGFYATLKTGVSVASENQYIAITAKGADAAKFTVLPLGGNGEYDAFTGSLKPVKTIEGADGSVTYIFEVPKTAGKTINALRVTPLGNTTGSWKATNISISDILIGNSAIMQANGYII